MGKHKYTKEEIRIRIETEPDFINSKRHNYSLMSLEARNPNGVHDRSAAALLGVTLQEFQKLFQSAIKKYRQSFQVEIDLENESNKI